MQLVDPITVKDIGCQRRRRKNEEKEDFHCTSPSDPASPVSPTQPCVDRFPYQSLTMIPIGNSYLVLIVNPAAFNHCCN